MAFKATVKATEDAFDVIRRVLVDVKRVTSDHRSLLSTNPVSVTSVMAPLRQVSSALNIINPLKSTPGLAQYARDQVNDQTYDIVAEYNAAEAAMIAMRDGIISAFPVDASGYLLYEKFNADGTISFRTFTPAQVSSLLPLYDAVINAIE